MIETAVVLAAGRGTRLRPLTAQRSKAMLPVAGRPLLYRNLSHLAQAGIQRAVVVVAPHNEAEVQTYVADHPPPLDLHLCRQATPRGTADALQAAAPAVNGDFLLVAVDNLLPVADLRAIISRFATGTARLVLALIPASADEIARSAGVEIDGAHITRFEEKPSQPSAGYASPLVYACAHDFLAAVAQVGYSPRGEREVAAAVQAWLDQDQPLGYHIAARRWHLTFPADLLTLNHHWLAAADGPPEQAAPPGVHIQPPVAIGQAVTIGAAAHLGPYITLEDGVQVGAGARLAHCVALRGADIPPGAVFEGCVLTPDGPFYPPEAD